MHAVFSGDHAACSPAVFQPPTAPKYPPGLWLAQESYRVNTQSTFSSDSECESAESSIGQPPASMYLGVWPEKEESYKVNTQSPLPSDCECSSPALLRRSLAHGVWPAQQESHTVNTRSTCLSDSKCESKVTCSTALCDIPRGTTRKQLFKALAKKGFTSGKNIEIPHVRLPRQGGSKDSKDSFDVLVWFFDVAVMREFEKTFRKRRMRLGEAVCEVFVKASSEKADPKIWPDASAIPAPRWFVALP
jgi:hypothetical protein